MSVATGSSTEPVTVYVRLLGEGTVVFRPSSAELLADDVARLVAPTNYDPEDEDWELKPDSVVRLERRTLDGGKSDVLVAVALVE